MPGWYRRVFLAAVFIALLPAALAQGQNTTDRRGATAPGGGFDTLTGAEAEFYDLPGDVRLVNSMRLDRYGLTYERYQQFLGEAKVLGGQLTLYRDDSGTVTTVIGAHYPNLVPSNRVQLSRAEAHGIVDRDIGPAGERITELMIDPASGRYFYWVETRRTASRWILWIGAQGGQVINKYNALMHQVGCAEGVFAPCGFGVEYDDGDTGDVKDLTGLTTYQGSEFRLQTNRLITRDEGSTRTGWYYLDPSNYPIATDDDDAWVLPGDNSPDQPALIDGHYYAWVTDEYYLARHSADWVAMNGGIPITVLAHFKDGYNNAFWNGIIIALGDGDQVNFRELTSLDVVAHELTHGITEFTSNLIYQNESGALNESFSDMMASNAEFYAADKSLEPAGLPPDWLIGEDIDLRGGINPGFRNMADPEEDGDPDHYSERYTGTADNGGVHWNSGIPNQAYYLLVEGGKNASCASPGDHYSLHCTGGIGDGTPVTGIGIGAAETIFFLGFTALSSGASMCDARAATEASATLLFPGPSLELASTTNAWRAVGLTDTVCGLTINTPPTAGNDAASTDEDNWVNISVLANDSDPDGDALSVASVSQGANGRVVNNGNSVTYTPNANFYGGDSFTYTATDGNDVSNVATVTVTVTAVNDAPSASFTYSCAGLECTFTSTSSDPDGTIVSHSWAFGDGGTSSETDPSHTYGTARTYNVTLTVTDNLGASSTPASQEVTVSDSTQSGSLTISITRPTDGAEVSGKRVRLVAEISGDGSVDYVEFVLGNFSIGTDGDGSDGWMIRWDSRGESDGGHILKAIAIQMEPEMLFTWSGPVTINVNNSGGSDGGGSDGGGGGGGGKGVCKKNPDHPNCSQ